MSFFADLEDEEVLKEALAFIDGLEAPPPSPPLLLLRGQDAAQPVGDPRAATDAVRPKRARRREREAEIDAARRRRKKDARLALLREARVLELRLSVLRESKAQSRSGLCETASEVAVANDSTGGGWKRRALAQAREAITSTEANRKLRDAIRRQRALLIGVRDALVRAQPTQPLCAPSPSTDQPESEGSRMLALKSSTHQLYDDLESVIASAGSSSDVVTSSLAIKMDPVLGPYSEHTTMTLVPRELGSVAAVIEESLLQLSPPCSDLEFIVQTTPSDECLGFEKQYTVELYSPGRTVPMSGAGFIRIYREPSRVVVLWSKELIHGIGFRFHERCWFVAARSPAHPFKQSVARSCCRLEVERPRNSPVSQEGEDVCAFIRAKLVARMRCRIEAVQSKLLEPSVDETADALSGCVSFSHM